jgi:hypothetical protein
MARLAIILLGLFLAGVFAAVMYAIYGNLSWGSEALDSLPWFEPTFWALALSGLIFIILRDIGAWLLSVFGQKAHPSNRPK